MATHKSIAFRIYFMAQVLKVLKDSDDLYEFACIVAEIIQKDRAIVHSLTDVNIPFNEALKEHLKSLLRTPERTRMLDVAQAFHDALQNRDLKNYEVRLWAETSFEFLDKVRCAM